jgi:hypothetical protein
MDVREILPVMDEMRARKLAHNEALFREVNETIAVARGSWPSDLTRFICECSDQQCFETIPLPPDDYHRLRSRETWFVVLPGHEQPDLESVVERGGGFVFVEKPSRLLAELFPPHDAPR